jgi:hypothetical protein
MVPQQGQICVEGMQGQSLTQQVAANVLLAKIGLLLGPTYSKGAQLLRMPLPNGLTQVVQRVTGTLSWLLKASLSGLVRFANATLSPAVEPMAGKVYCLQQQMHGFA